MAGIAAVARLLGFALPQRVSLNMPEIAAAPRANQHPSLGLTAPVPRGRERLASRAGALSIGAVACIYAVMGLFLVDIARAPSVYPDSGTALSISKRFADGDWRAVWNTQSPPLQDGVYALIFKLHLMAMVGYPVGISLFVLVLLLGWFAYRATGVFITAGVPAAIILFSNAIWDQAGYLTFYPVFAVLGYAGLFVAIRYQLRGGSLGWPLLAASLLTLALQAYTTALVFLLVPAIALVCYWSAPVAKRSILVYACITAAAAPWLAWHIAVGGVSHVYYHPLNWFTEKYLGIVNEQFWDYPHQSLSQYVRTMAEVGANGIMPWYLLAFTLPGLAVTCRTLGIRAAVFCVASAGAYLAILAVTRPSPFARYYFPIIPLLVLLVAAGIIGTCVWIRTAAWPDQRTDYRPVAPLLFGVVVVAALMPLAGLAAPAVSDAREHFVTRLDTSPGYDDLTNMAALIGASHGGVISRDSAIQTLLPDNQVYSHYLLTEDEYVTFLSWPTDEDVISVLRSRNIEWVLLRNDIAWERDYNVWLTEAYGLAPIHYMRVVQSPLFEQSFAGRVYTLYRLK